MSTAEQRAQMPKGTQAVLDRRTLFNANRNLLPLLKEGQCVLDVGCGSGSITAGIAEIVGSTGQVIGIDSSSHLIELARKQYGHLANLHFEATELRHYLSSEPFHVVSSARVLQWLAHPDEAVGHMVSLVRPGGWLSVLDYNHCKIEWKPKPPQSMQLFYDTFLKWRTEAGMDNTIADRLSQIFTDHGLTQIHLEDHSEVSQKQITGFEAEASIWTKVAETRGQQLVADGYMAEELRVQAIHDYERWIQEEGQSMKLYLLAVTGQKPGELR
ncbi:Ubiquinone/menaquinone biosynthesis C-methylase UbiE [bacterium A37T11]|nr:Ubiquinone/menaquinone biosynthesis C-methylase UbiE [bacterium A37T11]